MPETSWLNSCRRGELSIAGRRQRDCGKNFGRARIRRQRSIAPRDSSKRQAYAERPRALAEKVGRTHRNRGSLPPARAMRRAAGLSPWIQLTHRRNSLQRRQLLKRVNLPCCAATCQRPAACSPQIPRGIRPELGQKFLDNGRLPIILDKCAAVWRLQRTWRLFHGNPLCPSRPTRRTVSRSLLTGTVDRRCG